MSLSNATENATLKMHLQGTDPSYRAGATQYLALFTADKPSFSCLAVHVPQGRYITAEELYAAAALPDVVARVVARNAAVGAALDTECNAAFTADESAVFKQSSSKVEER